MGVRIETSKFGVFGKTIRELKADEKFYTVRNRKIRLLDGEEFFLDSYIVAWKGPGASLVEERFHDANRGKKIKPFYRYNLPIPIGRTEKTGFIRRQKVTII